MSEARRSHKIDPLIVNGIEITVVTIDTHYERKHRDHVNDSLILKLVRKLDGRRELPEARVGKYAYFNTLVELSNRQYRLIWLLENHEIYIGVVNAYRDDRKR